MVQVRQNARRWSLVICRRLCGTPGAQPGEASPQLEDSCPGYGDLTAFLTVREGGGRGEMVQVRQNARRWSLVICRRLCGTPGAQPDEARPQSEDSCPSYGDFTPVLTGREGGGRGEMVQVRQDACRWSLVICRRLRGTPGAQPDEARPQSEDSCPSYGDLTPVLTVRAREGGGRGEMVQVRQDACRWSLVICRRLRGTPGAQPGKARPQSEDSCPSYGDLNAVLTVRAREGRVEDGVRWCK